MQTNPEEWLNAMFEKTKALLKNDTWRLVPPPPGVSLVRCKWVLHIYRNPDSVLI